jgi:hypothetical protein
MTIIGGKPWTISLNPKVEPHGPPANGGDDQAVIVRDGLIDVHGEGEALLPRQPACRVTSIAPDREVLAARRDDHDVRFAARLREAVAERLHHLVVDEVVVLRAIEGQPRNATV